MLFEQLYYNTNKKHKYGYVKEIWIDGKDCS